MKKAFTLSEVLITLGIIGIVAILVMPGIITKFQKLRTETQLKKAYAELKNAIDLAVIDLGPVKDWEVYDLYNTTQQTHLANILSQYYKGAVMIDRKLRCSDGITSMSGACPSGIHGSRGKSFATADGKIIYCFGNWIFIDINGYKNPNVQGKDIFELRLNINNKPIVMHGEGESKTSIYTTSGEGACRNTSPDPNGHNGNKCGAVIMQNSWKIPDDYPW